MRRFSTTPSVAHSVANSDADAEHLSAQEDEQETADEVGPVDQDVVASVPKVRHETAKVKGRCFTAPDGAGIRFCFPRLTSSSGEWERSRPLVCGLSFHGVSGLCVSSLAHTLRSGIQAQGMRRRPMQAWVLALGVGQLPVIRTPWVSSVAPTKSTAQDVVDTKVTGQKCCTDAQEGTGKTQGEGIGRCGAQQKTKKKCSFMQSLGSKEATPSR